MSRLFYEQHLDPESRERRLYKTKRWLRKDAVPTIDCFPYRAERSSVLSLVRTRINSVTQIKLPLFYNFFPRNICQLCSLHRDKLSSNSSVSLVSAEKTGWCKMFRTSNPSNNSFGSIVIRVHQQGDPRNFYKCSLKEKRSMVFIFKSYIKCFE